MNNLPATSKPKGRYKLQYRGTECTNCAHPLDLSDRFCPHCSQINSTKKPTLKDFFDEFFSSLISYDSKLLKTLSALLLRPGKITRDYLTGKRVSYTNPFRFLLSLSIIYFLMINFNLSSGLSKLDKYGSDQKGSFFNPDGTMTFGKNLKELEEESQGAFKLQIPDSLEIATELKKRDSIYLSNPKQALKKADSLSFLGAFSTRREIFTVLIEENKTMDYEALLNKYDLDNTRGNLYAFNAGGSYLRFTQRPGSFTAKLISKLPFLIFFFLPVFTVFIWDLFTGWIFVLIFMVYLYKAMRNFYKQGRFKTIVKFAFLNFIFVILGILSVGILLAGSVYTF